MDKLKRARHQLIWQVLEQFNTEFLVENNILFGGGTRIALELNEFRESTDIDFFCAGAASYRQVRLQAEAISLGQVLQPDHSLVFPREIRADRDGVRTYIQLKGSDEPIKLEFIRFDICEISADTKPHRFPVPIVDRSTCYLTKLLANADRYAESNKKDIFDLCMMKKEWGCIPKKVWQEADAAYGMQTVVKGLEKALAGLALNTEEAISRAVKVLKMQEDVATELVEVVAKELLQEVQLKT